MVEFGAALRRSGRKRDALEMLKEGMDRAERCGGHVLVRKAMRDNVIQRVEGLTGLDVTEVNITVKDVFFPEQQ